MLLASEALTSGRCGGVTSLAFGWTRIGAVLVTATSRAPGMGDGFSFPCATPANAAMKTAAETNAAPAYRMAPDSEDERRDRMAYSMDVALLATSRTANDLVLRNSCAN